MKAYGTKRQDHFFQNIDFYWAVRVSKEFARARRKTARRNAKEDIRRALEEKNGTT